MSSTKRAEKLKLGALGSQGVAEMRARGLAFDKTVPAAYYAALLGIFDGDRLLDCPLLLSSVEGETGFQLHSVYYHGFYRDIIAGGQG